MIPPSDVMAAVTPADIRRKGSLGEPLRRAATLLNRVVLGALLLPGRLVLFPLFLLSTVTPRRRNLWVFGSWGGRRFADNAAAFFAFCHARRYPADLVWITRRRTIAEQLRARGYRAHLAWSPLGVAMCLRAGVYVFDCFSKDINFWLSGGAVKINLWSGVPLKSFERDIDNPRSRYYRLFHGSAAERWIWGALMPWHAQKPHLLIATSEETAAITQRAFAVRAEQVAITGYPRNDELLEDRRDAEPPIVFRDALSANRKVFLYLPTFRDNAKPFMQLDWARLDQAMATLGAEFFIKRHPVDRGAALPHYQHVHELEQDIDVYGLLPHTTALISDYSSIIFDYMLLRKPIVSYLPDLHDFERDVRSLNFHPTEVATGPVCSNCQELLHALVEIASRAQHDGELKSAEHVVRRFHKQLDGEASERVLRAIEQCLSQTPR
jgi:CDP-glycerol glycerophosphotransferase (TagB/SpsB family)